MGLELHPPKKISYKQTILETHPTKKQQHPKNIHPNTFVFIVIVVIFFSFFWAPKPLWPYVLLVFHLGAPAGGAEMVPTPAEDAQRPAAWGRAGAGDPVEWGDGLKRPSKEFQSLKNQQ